MKQHHPLSFPDWSRAHLLIHPFLWMLLYMVPALIHAGLDRQGDRIFYLWLIVPLLLLMGGFYANYFLLIPKLLSQRRFTLFLLANLGVFALVFALGGFWRSYMFITGLLPRHPLPSLGIQMLQAVMGMVFIVGLAMAMRVTRDWFHAESRAERLEAESLRTELDFLRLQLSPHFLFNTLNNVVALIDLDAEKAKATVRDLSALLRAMLYESDTEKVPLLKEIDFLKSYIRLMLLRYGDDLDFQMSLDLEQEGKDLQIAPLLLVPLVENSFKHGILPGAQNEISIHIKTQNGRLFYTSENSYHPKTSSDKSGSGVGIQNMRKRLALLYPGKSFYDNKIEAGKYKIRFELNLLNSRP
jgi:sensor histidine kinase YesM